MELYIYIYIYIILGESVMTNHGNGDCNVYIKYFPTQRFP